MNLSPIECRESGPTSDGRKMMLPTTTVRHQKPYLSSCFSGSRESCIPPVMFSSSSVRISSSSLRCAVLGAGFAGLSVAYHLLECSPGSLHLCVDIYDEVGVGGGASGAAGGLLHPYSPKAKLLWQGAECWNECLNLLRVAEEAVPARKSIEKGQEIDSKVDGPIVWRRGILKPAMNMKAFNLLNSNAQNCITTCRIEPINKDAVQDLVPNFCEHFGSAFYMPQAVNIHPQRYVQALYSACQHQVTVASTSGIGGKELHLHKKSIDSLCDIAGEYDAVIICLGAKANMLPELRGKLPLRTCRGVMAQLQLPDYISEGYPEHGPSILSDAWLAVQGSHDLCVGATREWGSKDTSGRVSAGEASKALDELIPKVSAVYPSIRDWTLYEARAGLRAMPPLTSNGSLPLLGCINGLAGARNSCKYWLFGGLGSRGLLYHAWLGKLMARAVLSCDEELIPCELTSWKNRRN